MGLSPLLHLLPFFRRYRTAYVIGAASLVAAIVLRLLVPRFLGDTIDALRGIEAWTAAEFEGDEARRLVLAGALAIVGTAFAGSFVRTASRWLILGASRRVVHDMREQLYDKLARLAPSFFLRHSTGQILSRGMNDMQNMQGLTGPVFLYLAETGLLFAIGLTAMAAIDPWLTLAAFAPFPVFVFRARQLAKRIQEGSRAAQDSLGELSDKVAESLGGILVIKTLSLEKFDYGRVSDHCEEYRALNLEVTKARAALMPLMVGLTSLSILIALLVGAPMVGGRITTGDFVAFFFYLQLLSAPVATLGFVISSLQRGAAAMERIREVQGADETLPDPPDPVEVAEPRGALSVRGLDVDRPAAELHHDHGLEVPTPPEELPVRRVLSDVSFEAPAGSTIGIVGHTGSGKSTLVAALARLLEVPEGRVFVDGVDVTRMRVRDVRRLVGYVPQDPFLFSATLGDNLKLGRPDATDEEVAEALRISRLEQDLPWIPGGLGALVGERGVKLSGGQRQRAALARAVLRRPRILVLDDTLSAVDTATADAILDGLEPIMRGRTTIVVAHRLSTVRAADRILVLDEGRIVESGSHDELLARGGVYADLWASQEETAAVEAAEGRA